jgi:hypothetical protein
LQPKYVSFCFEEETGKKNKNLQQIQEWGVTPHSRKTRRKKVV